VSTLTIELGRALAAAVERTGAGVEAQVVAELTPLAEQLGVGLDVTTAAAAAFGVLVDGVPRPCPPELAARVWDAVAPEADRRFPAGELSEGRGADASWLEAYAAQADEDGRAALAALVVRLAVAVVHERPSVLLGAGAEPAAAACGRLLDLGVGRFDIPSARAHLRAYDELGVSFDDALEILFDDLRPARLEVCLSPADAALLGAASPFVPISVYTPDLDEGMRVGFRTLEEGMYPELGLILPDLVLVPEPAQRERSVSVRVNDLLGPPLPTPGPGEVIAWASPAQLAAVGIDGASPTLVPTTELGALVPLAAAATVASYGTTTWALADYLAFAVATEVRRRAECLLGAEDVEYRLAVLAGDAPALVEAARERFTVEELTRGLRRLVAEGSSIWDLRGILERALELEPGDGDEALAGLARTS
jgi:hypothetical protein